MNNLLTDETKKKLINPKRYINFFPKGRNKKKQAHIYICTIYTYDIYTQTFFPK